jgi:hypothetical protein
VIISGITRHGVRSATPQAAAARFGVLCNLFGLGEQIADLPIPPRELR